MSDVILDWLIEMIRQFTNAGRNLQGDLKVLNDARLEYWSELATSRIDQLKREKGIKCPECGTTEYYRTIYTDDTMTKVNFYDCMMCHTHWDEEGNNLGKY